MNPKRRRKLSGPNSIRPADTIETVVIGGGQAGLAAGFHLQKAGRDFVVLDAGSRVGESWRSRWDSLRLFTPARYDGLPGMAFPGSASRYPTKDEMADYLESYAERYRLPVRNGVAVSRLDREGEMFRIHSDSGVIHANNVIVSTGFDHHPKIPPFAAELDDRIVQHHSKEYRNPGQIQDGSVLVVGAGNSGAEIAVELARAGHRTTLAGRDVGQEPTKAGSLPDKLLTPLMWLVATRVVTVDSFIGKKARDAFLDPPRGIPRGRVSGKEIEEAGIDWVARVEGTEHGKPLLEDGRVIDTDTVIWCTGFRPGYTDWIDIPLEEKHGIPVHDRGIIEEVPGLYFLGLYFQYSLSSPLVGGVGRDAEYVVSHLVRRPMQAETASAGSS
jgi:putative flavoprotein involved in K+ transport